VTVSRSAARIPEKRRLRRRRATRLRGSICCNRRRRNESTGASGRGPPWPPHRLRPSTVPWLRGAGGPTGATTGPRPPDPPPSAIGRPIELFVHPAAATYIRAQDDTTSPRVHLSHARTLAILSLLLWLLLLLLLFFSCSSAAPSPQHLSFNAAAATAQPSPFHKYIYIYHTDRYVCGEYYI